METSKTNTETKTKSIFALESDEETPVERDSGLADSFEKSPVLSNKEECKSSAVEDELTNKSGNDSLSITNDEQNQASNEVEPDNVLDTNPSQPETKISPFQRARIEKNRQKALLLRQARLQAHPYRK